MNEIKHTPGPWLVSGIPIALVYDEKGKRICSLIDKDKDAYLISAAPELYHLAELLLDYDCGKGNKTLSEIITLADKAFLKANGK